VIQVKPLTNTFAMRKCVGYFYASSFAALLFFGLHDTSLSKTLVHIIQYNVKSGQGGWTVDHDIIGKQISIITDKLKTDTVDFITLEQSGDSDNSRVLISDAIGTAGFSGWKTIVSKCHKDVTQLAYSPDWELIGSSRSNPLVDGLSPQRGWKGCDFDNNSDSHLDPRPYNIALFQRIIDQTKLLIIITHMPHCYAAYLRACLSVSV
jgi:hypothetical protein